MDSRRVGYLTHEDINKYLNECKLYPSVSVMRELMNKLDPNAEKKILFESYRSLFYDLTDEEIKFILERIAEELYNN